MKSKIQLAIMLILSVQILFAQRGKHHQHFAISEALQEELNLSTEQKTELESLKADFKEKMQALRSEDMENREEKRAAMKELMEAHKAALQEILTEDQLVILKEKRKAHKERKHQRLSKEDRENLKAELVAYRNENIQPVLLAQREKLEADISSEDKETIAALRLAFKEKRAARKEARKENHKEMKDKKGKKHHRINKEERATRKEAFENDEDRKALKALAEKYETEINALYKEIADQRKEWKEDTKAIIKKYKAEEEGHKHRRHGHKGKRKEKGKKKAMKHKMGKMSKGAFLLLNPNQVQDNTLSNASTQIRVYPNPSVNANTLTYTVKEAGKVKIEIHDQSGKMVRVLLNDYRTPGTYNLNIPLENLKNRVYYYVVSDKQGITSKKIIISSQQ